MPTGKIKWFNPKKGYGFIDVDGEEKDMFLHITALQAANIGMNTANKIVIERRRYLIIITTEVNL